MTDAMMATEPQQEPQPMQAAPAWTPDDYWAAAPREQLGALMDERVTRFYEALKETGRLSLWQRSLAAYYGEDPDSGASSHGVSFAGTQGEVVLACANHYGSLVNHAHVLITASRPAAKPQAANTTYGATEDTLLADRIIEYDLHHKGLEDAQKHVARLAYQCGEGWLYQAWDTQAGRAYGADPETGKRVYEGDVKLIPLAPIDVIRDPHHAVSPTQEHEWLIVRRPMNRHKLLAQFPEHAAVIRALKPVSDTDKDRVLRMTGGRTGTVTDEVWGYELFHAPSCIAGMHAGRYALMLETTCVLATPLPYETLPVHAMYADHEEGSAFGFSPAWNLLGPQQQLNAAMSTVATNHDAFGIQSVWMPPGEDEPDVTIVGGLRFVRTQVRPEALQLLTVAKESFDWIALQQDVMQTLIGINDVVRGDPGANTKSGASQAFIAAMALQIMSGPQQGYARLLERSYSALIGIYKAFVKAPRLLELAGDDMASTVKQWTGQDLQGVSRIIVQIGNPAMNTLAARKELADEYAERGWITTPEQYAMVLTTGRVEPILKRDRDEMRLIAKENEALRRGTPELKALIEQGPPQPPMVMPGDPMAMQAMAEHEQAVAAYEAQLNAQLEAVAPVIKYHRHLLHLREQSAVVNAPEALDDPMLAKVAAAHLAWHERERARMVAEEPWLLEALGEPLTPSEQMMAQGPPPGPDVAGMPGEGGIPAPSPANDNGMPPMAANDNAPPDQRGPVVGIEGMPSPGQAPLMPLMPDGSGRARVDVGGIG